MNKETGVKGLIGYKLKRTQHALRLKMDDALQQLELTTPQYSVLAQIELKSRAFNATLARSVFVKPQTMHGILVNLEKRNLIKRQVDANNGKILFVELTDQGRDTIIVAHELIRAVEDRMLVGVSETNKVLFEKLLLQYFNNLNAME